MSGPGGMTTKRDQRRDSRLAKSQQQRVERERARTRAIRNRRLQRVAVIAVGVIALALVAFFVIHATIGAGPAATPKHQNYTTPAGGETRDGLVCAAQEGVAEHFHVYVAFYANGRQQEVTPNTGIVAGLCLYPLHVHAGDANVVHIEAPSQSNFTLGQFFDIWGKPLSRTQAGAFTASAQQALVYKTVDASGHVTTVTGDPRGIALAPHETIYILYNSPAVEAKAFTGWLPGE